MKKYKAKFIVSASIFLAVSILVGAGAVAATSYGTSSDPLVSLSYLTDVLTTDVLEELDENVQETKTELETQFSADIADFQEDIEEALSSYTGENSSASFTVVTLSEGQILKCGVGTEIMLRIGTATGYGSNEPVLVNETAGSTLSAGASLVKNNMYMVTIADNGIKATAATVKVLVCGTYTIS